MAKEFVLTKAAEILKFAREEIIEVTLFDIKNESEEILRTGFGIPRLVVSGMTICCAATAAFGTTSIGVDFIQKVFGPKECVGCNGWEGLACASCKGIGFVQFVPPLKTANQSKTNPAGPKQSPSLVPFGVTVAPLPAKQCPTCSGSGVMKCTVCRGNAWKMGINFDNLFAPPSRVWDLYRLSPAPLTARETQVQRTPPSFDSLAVRMDGKDGADFSEIANETLNSPVHRGQLYEMFRQHVVTKLPGWERAQEAMLKLDPSKAIRDSSIVRDLLQYQQMLALKGVTSALKAPPKPASWKSPSGLTGERETEEWERVWRKRKEERVLKKFLKSDRSKRAIASK